MTSSPKSARRFVAGVHLLSLLLTIVLAAVSNAAETPGAITPEQSAFFESKVRPVLADNCYKCHGEKKHAAGLRVDSLAALLTGGDTGPAIVPGDPDKSRLIKAIRYVDEDMQM